MKSKQIKINAFTISEMIVVLLITVVVVGLAFSTLGLIQKQMNAIGGNYDRNTETNLLRQALWIDFATYPYAAYDSKTDNIRLENEIGYATYSIAKDYIIKEKDTFHITLAEKTFYLDGLQVESGQIDALELLSIQEQGGKTIFVHTENAAAEYMQ